MSAREQIVERIGREGPIAFDAYVELALYGEGGFFSRGRGAGRAGRDFVTSPEVGALFGALVGRAELTIAERPYTEEAEPSGGGQ